MLEKDDPKACFSGSDDNSTYQDDGEMKSHHEETHMIWTLLKVATLLSCAYYYYILGEKENDTKVEKDDSVSSSTNTPSTEQCPIRENARQQGLVLYDGNWYSVAKFVPYHPGGAEILHQYLGSDVSFAVRVMHRNPENILKHRKPVRAASEEERRVLSTRREDICREMMEDHRVNSPSKTLSSSSNGSTKLFNLEAFEKDVHELYQHFSKKGYFKPTLFWLIHKTTLVLLLLSLSILSMKILPMIQPTETPITYILPGIFLGLFWHQSGFLMHDAEHHNLVGNERINDILGWMYGTVFLGVNGAWWREEHREHHALLNTFDDDGFKDPQMREDVWIQHKKLIPFYGQELVHFLANFQHILFVPIIFFVGRIGIVIDSTLTERKFRPWTIFGNILHILLHYSILSQTSYPLQVYIVASFQQAILSLQLLGNHYTKPWNPVHAATEGNYCVWQILCTQDFECPSWARWYYGGLNFHYCHHLFPTLPREYFYIATPHIQQLCEKHGLPFIEIGFVDCVVEMVTNFNEVRKDFAKHGSGSIALAYT